MIFQATLTATLSPSRVLIIAVFSSTATFMFACTIFMVATDLCPLSGVTCLVAIATVALTGSPYSTDTILITVQLLAQSVFACI